jgi:hypothetical protein
MTRPPAKPTAAQLEFFEKEVRPVLVARCYKCHAAESKKVREGSGWTRARGC